MNDGILVWVAILAASISLFAATIAMLSVHDAVNVTQLKPPAHHTESISPGPGKVECY
jgi:hypothetical protein